jgi:ribA/ribD-fused uncharacterized protein
MPALVACLPSPRDAFNFTRKYPDQIISNWQSIKIDVMITALRAKFTQHSYLADSLISTNGISLSEHTNNDKFWGDNLDDTGKNWLGILLMKIRDELCINRKTDIKPINGRINFYEKTAPYYEFTNFYPAPLMIDSILFPTSEHYFQAQKFSHLSVSDFIKSRKSPFEVAEFGLPLFNNFIVNNWNSVRTNLLEIALLEKAKDPNIIQLLLSTKNHPIVYLNPKDPKWGATPTGGDNYMGEFWVSIRKTINNNKH